MKYIFLDYDYIMYYAEIFDFSKNNRCKNAFLIDQKVSYLLHYNEANSDELIKPLRLDLNM